MKESKLLKDYPEALKDWDYKLNTDVLKPEFLHAHTDKEYYWKCSKGHPSYKCSLYKKTYRHYGCPVCSNRKVIAGDNDFASNHPDKMLDWDNNKNTLDPTKVPASSSLKAFWKCHVCGHEWHSEFRDASSKEINCPKCSKIASGHKRHICALKLNGGITDKKLLLDWDYSKNDRAPSEFSPQSNEYAYWKCHVCGYEWRAKVNNRFHGRGCPACGNKVLVKGKNDFATKFPELAKEWHTKKNGNLKPEDVMPGSAKKVWWICRFGHQPYLKSLNHRTSQNAGCPICKRGRQSSFAERALYFYTKQFFPDSINRYKDIFDNGMELDVYIPSLKLGIEYDGVAFHKTERLEREKRKYLICKKNHIKLIRIKEQNLDEVWFENVADKMYQTEYDGKDLLKLENTIRWVLGKITFNFNNLPLDIDIYRDENKIRNINPSYLKENSLATKHPEIAKQWHPIKNGELKPSMFLCGSSYNAWWLCPVCGNEWQSQINSRVAQKTGCKKCYLERIKTKCPNNKKIYRYSLDGLFIDEWRSLSHAGRELKINPSNISMCVNGIRKNAGGYIWSYSKKNKLF